MNRKVFDAKYRTLAESEQIWLGIEAEQDRGAKVCSVKDLSGLDVVIMVEAWEGLERLCEAGEKATKGGR